jgi:hypothetical protein
MKTDFSVIKRAEELNALVLPDLCAERAAMLGQPPVLPGEIDENGQVDLAGMGTDRLEQLVEDLHGAREMYGTLSMSNEDAATVFRNWPNIRLNFESLQADGFIGAVRGMGLSEQCRTIADQLYLVIEEVHAELSKRSG